MLDENTLSRFHEFRLWSGDDRRAPSDGRRPLCVLSAVQVSPMTSYSGRKAAILDHSERYAATRENWRKK